ncbi:Rieske 2Fe-2S domain-containing protein [Nocardia speluncae]|uniref:Rieske 2Fe-2S domain-containing protein n=1 Tax=Nocardia speluncae TaxID=419477 RepID=A0A846X921_9NOCA|nr:aromatic ring-hydroxylating dioxygenase subunit alpha [Nocardia speluncae]NKY32462.1 Rieske 2Fe-2S domain-containing protein [Nocardia speluncae]
MSTVSVSAMEFVDLENGLVRKSAYTDPDLYTAEMNRIFERTWLYIAHASEVPEPGDYKTTEVAGRPVIVVRGADGEIRVLQNRCRHRAASVCQAPKGNARFFRCEYHGWTYRNSGELVGVTYPDAYQELDKSQLGLQSLPRVELYQDFVFVSLNPEVEPLDEHLGEAKKYIDLFVAQGAGRPLAAAYGTQKIRYGGNWKYQLENGCDGYHPNFAHRSFFRVMAERTGEEGLGSYMDGSAAAESLSLGRGHTLLDQRNTATDHYAERYRASPDVDDIVAELRKELSEEEMNRLLANSTSPGFNLTVFPNLQLIGLHIREIRPVSVDETVVHYTPLAVDGVPDGINQLRMRNHELFYSAAGFGVPDDGEMFRRVSVGVGSDTEWLLLSRGKHRENPQGDVVSAHITDELPQRAEWARWAELMDDDA